MRNTFLNEIVERAKVDKNIVMLTGDLGYGCLKSFAVACPDRYFNVGIAEQNMMSMAAGLALEGKKVFIYSIGNFNTLRCLEQIRNDVCYMGLDVNIISVGAGLEYGQLGFSHHSTEDISCMRAMPNMSVFDPATKSEAQNVAKYMLDTKGPCYIRLNKREIEISHKSPTNLNPYIVKTGNSRVAILACGTVLAEAIRASEMLEVDGISSFVWSVPKIKPINDKVLIKNLCEFDYIFTVEEHTRLGGFGSMVAELLCSVKGKKPIQTIIGIDDYVCSVVGDRNFLRKEYRIDAKGICGIIRKTLR